MISREPDTAHVDEALLSALRAQTGKGCDLDEPKTTVFRRRDCDLRTSSAKRPALEESLRGGSHGAERRTSEPATELEVVAKAIKVTSAASSSQEETPVLLRPAPTKRRAVPLGALCVTVTVGAILMWRLAPPHQEPERPVVRAAAAAGLPRSEGAQETSPSRPQNAELADPRPGDHQARVPSQLQGDSTREPSIPSSAPQRRRAVELLVTGQNADALDMYRALSRSAKEDAAYALIVRVLEQDAQRCKEEGKPCVP